MNNRQEKVIEIISDLKDAFPETQDSVFVALAKAMIRREYKDEDIAQMVENTIDNVPKTRLTVADVISFSYEKSKEIW